MGDLPFACLAWAIGAVVLLVLWALTVWVIGLGVGW